ncbi:deubiquitinase OTUD6B-like [Clavelina lepadiformis]|uniref:deubiquitinase OTUD6B-like n=1 Tax=Clavelina lepadiformis TaxID=159417 RepID=UPI004042BB28
MSDLEESINPKEKLLENQRKEKKEFQAKIQAIKKSIPNGNKARAKEAKKTIEALQNELRLKHEKELYELEKNNAVDGIACQLAESNITEQSKSEQPARISKAQKRRVKKTAKAKEIAARLDEAEADYCKTERYKEETSIKNKLKEMGLVIKAINPDGNCMYSAIQVQLDVSLSIQELREKTASHIRSHKDHFIPFLANKTTGDKLSDDEFEDYCLEIEEPATWGGQLELLALSEVLHIPIHVIQSSTPVTILGEEHTSKPIILTFHRHELGLGEHYNAAVEQVNQDEVIR